MGALPSKESGSDFECYAPIHGRYTKLDEELNPQCDNDVTQKVKSAGVKNGSASHLHQSSKLENRTKGSSCNSCPRLKIYRNLTLPMIIRRRPSYRKAIRETDYIATILQQGTIEGKKTLTKENNWSVKNEIEILMTEHRTAYEKNAVDLVRKKPALKVRRRHSKRHMPYENPQLASNEEHEVSVKIVKRSTNDGEREIDIEKLTTDLRTAYELKKNVAKKPDKIFCANEKSTLKTNNRQCKRRTPYERIKPKPTLEINNQNETAQKQKTKSILLMEIEAKLHKLRKTGIEKLLDTERSGRIKPYFVSCIPLAQEIIKEAFLRELKQHFSKINKN